MTDYTLKPVSQQLKALEAGQITATRLLEQHIDRYEAINPRIRAVIKTDIDRARERASGLDRMRKDGRTLGPLHGIPMTIKDTLDVDGMPATAGAAEYKDRDRQVANAVAVDRVKQAGAIVWGKTNVPYMAGDWQSYNSVFGTTSNPWDTDRSPGGSSGGAAAALATGITPIEIGSDIGGSLRTPAHFCGVASLKPTYGVISQRGHIPPDPSYFANVDLNVVGPMARTMSDVHLLYSILSGRASDLQSGAMPLKGKRIAIWAEEDVFPLSTECASGLLTAAEAAKSDGADIATVKPDIDGAKLIELYTELLIPLVAMDLPKAAQFGLTLARPLFHLQRALGAGPFSSANWGLKAMTAHRSWLRASGERARLKEVMNEFFGSWDAIIAPVTPTPAFPKNEKGSVVSRKLDVNGESVPYASNLSWIALATVCHLPAAVITVGKTAAGLPIGVQIIGKHGEDVKVLALAESLEAVLGGFVAPDMALEF